MTAPNLDDRLGIIRRLSSPMKPIPTGHESRLVELNGIRVVLFDIYGTLFISGSGDIGVRAAQDSSDALTEAFPAAGYMLADSAAAEQGVELLAGVIREFHNSGRESGVDYPEVDIRSVWGEVIQILDEQGAFSALPSGDEGIERLAIEYECRVNPVWPMPGFLEVLQKLKAGSVRLGVVSNAQFITPLLFPSLTGCDLAALGFELEWCVWSYRHLAAKPSPRLFQRVLDRVGEEGIAPEQTLYVGNDMKNDITPAARLGCRTALFAGDQRSLRLRKDDPFCRGIQPDLVLTDLRDLLSVGL